MLERDQLGAILSALSDPDRRQLLVALFKHNPQYSDDPDPLNIVAEAEEDRRLLQPQMVHTHLSKLRELGFIEWDADENRFSTGPRCDDIAPLLYLIEDHQDELPKGWL